MPPPQPPPLPPSPHPPALVARCRAGLLTSRSRTMRAELEVHRTHLRIESPIVRAVSAYARRLSTDDLVLSFDQIELLRPIGAMAVVVELPFDAAIALVGPSVGTTLAAMGDAVPVVPRRIRPFFVNFWLVHNRTGPIIDARPLT